MIRHTPKQGHILLFERSEAKYAPLPWIVSRDIFRGTVPSGLLLLHNARSKRGFVMEA